MGQIKTATHERLRAGEEALPVGSDRVFGVVMAVAFTVLGAWPLLGGGQPRGWGFVVAGVFLTLALARPRTLHPLNRLWQRLGLLLHRCITPVLMGVVFYGAVAPIGLVLRLSGKDPLRLRFEPERATYWIEREPPGPAADTMVRQF